MFETVNNVEVLDPFAEPGEGQPIDHLAAHQEITARYLANEVVHDYSADMFIRDTEILMLDAQFQEKWEAAEAIAVAAHALCGEDHAAQQSARANESFSFLVNSLLGNHDGHNHGSTPDLFGHKEDEDEDDNNTHARKKK